MPNGTIELKESAEIKIDKLSDERRFRQFYSLTLWHFRIACVGDNFRWDFLCAWGMSARQLACNFHGITNVEFATIVPWVVD